VIALAVFVAAALAFYWPMFAGKVIVGSDYYQAGWAFRHFGAEYWRQHHAIPLWNPYIFGGLPYVGGMHGDIFYPTAWLRWLLPLDLATNLTFAGHFVLAGGAMYALLRGLRLSWIAAVTGGLAYELSGILASQVSPGHDGKLFVSALAPFLFLALLRAVRKNSPAAYGAAALVVGLSLHGHPQTSYYLLVAAGIWTLFLVFAGAEGPQGAARWRALAWSFGAVVLGLGIYAIQALPFIEYIPFSPRGEAGPSGGWEYATGFAMPPAELFTTFLPQLNGVKEAYAGTNFFKDHTEYLGALVLLLAVCGLGGQERRRERLALGSIGLLFLLVAFGGHTPFYRAWYELMPMMKKVRAEGMAFYLVALPVCACAGFGAERLLAGGVSLRRLAIGAGCFAGFGLLAAIGALDGVAQALAAPELVARAAEHAGELHAGGLRLLVVAVLGGAALLAIRSGHLKGGAAGAALFLVVFADLWSVDREFFEFESPAQAFGGDAITTRMRQTPLPFRVWDPKGPLDQLGVYPGSWLMGLDIPQLLGYHGQELNTFDELLGGKNEWKNQVNLGLLRLFAVRYVVLGLPQTLPGYHKVLDSVVTTPRRSAALYEADSAPPWAWLMAGAIKVPDAQGADAVANPRFPALEIAVYPDSARVSPADLGGKLPSPPVATAAVTAWEPGSMRIAIAGKDERPLYLVVAENWYKDWEATVDGKPAPVLRAQHTLLSVEVPPGAREVAFVFRSRAYERGRLVSLASLLGVMALLLAPRFGRRRDADG
jgi:hypothetical protein